ncbi:ABC transporter ATP-binding protein [Ilumatobacter nonamiensis]|uniref:ABC transporter ATP-binding protein n=1 Tax=Ilumatobacter nonamiensis TaxID=467093 RepID=UPI00034CB763|nr:ABC transporter ATP-binding protein [Ilumatobacter nonamiensis]
MADTLLHVEGLRAGYGHSMILEDLSFSMGTEAVSIVGRNGMGKTTLCKTLMGMLVPTSGSITFDGTPIDGLPPEKIARHGIAYIPQGRRLFPSLSVDEHLQMFAKGTRGKRWTPEAVYELFPRLAERRGNGGAELSGGEQQMLAVGRALLLNAKLYLMDEPSEGLAPTIVDILIKAVHHLIEEDSAVLIVEQNLRAATSMAERQLVMVSGQIEHETTAAELRDDAALQKQYLGVDA